jgi:2-methylaconitate isomerase
MKPCALPAVFMRGGTSKALMFHARDLPSKRAEWDPLFLSAMGSPDSFGRQLNGMGGGLSSLSKVCVVAPSTRRDADVEYTFAQVLIKEPRVDYKGNCGNMLSAVGPFAVDEGLVKPDSDPATIRVYNTNTRKIIHATFPLEDGRARCDGDLVIPGVAGSGAPIRLNFLEPGGATTGKLLPSGRARETLHVPGLGELEVSMVDAGAACVFVRASDVGLIGVELPEALERNPNIPERLQAIRIRASIAMGIADDEATARTISTVPYIGFVSGAAEAQTLSGESMASGQMDLTVRMLSNGQVHRALPLAASMCAAVAARIDGSVVAEVLSPGACGRESIRLGMPSGILPVGVDVALTAQGWIARSGTFLRTARRLFEGKVYLSCPSQGHPGT